MKIQTGVVVLAVAVAMGSGCREGEVSESSDDAQVVGSNVVACGGCTGDDACEKAPEAAAEAAPEAAPAGTNILVTVAGEPLTQAELEMMMQQMMAQQGIPPQMAGQFMAQLGPQLKKQAMDQFIDRTLVLKEAKARKFEVTDADVDATLAKFAERLPEGMTLEQAVEAQGFTMEKLRADAFEGELSRLLFEAETAGVPEPTDEAVAAFYAENPQHFVTEEEAHARHILVGCEASEGDELRAAAKVKAEGLRKSLIEGADFAEVARENSTCSSAQKGGDLGSFGRGRMVPEFDAAAFSQGTNVIGEVIETQFGYHIVQVLERSDAATNALETVSDDIRGFLARQSKGEAFQTFAQSLREGAEIVYAEGQAE